jgi:hypothetical protein
MALAIRLSGTIPASKENEQVCPDRGNLFVVKKRGGAGMHLRQRFTGYVSWNQKVKNAGEIEDV